jgi:hypothetical protein
MLPARGGQMTARDHAIQFLSRDALIAKAETVPLSIVNTCFGPAAEQVHEENNASQPEGSNACGLSVRALNVLKLLAVDLTGETPARKDWMPSQAFLRALTLERLAYARNCGPRTMQEIIAWARSRGVRIGSQAPAGGSLPRLWRHLEARFNAGELTLAEVTAVLDRSAQQGNTRVPVAVQRILLKLLRQADESRA